MVFFYAVNHVSIMFALQNGREVTFTAEQAHGVCVFKIVLKDFTWRKKPRLAPSIEKYGARCPLTTEASVIVKQIAKAKQGKHPLLRHIVLCCLTF